jgi:hypothetical protein
MPTILKIVLPHHPLLGRNVNHDPASRGYPLGPAVAAKARDLGEVYHPTTCDVLDQANVGACTGDTGIEAIYADPILAANRATRTPGISATDAVLLSQAGKAWTQYAPNQDAAYRLYSAATRRDPYAGEFSYPPPGGDDTGSDGLTIAKVLVTAGVVSGYLWAFTADEALGALADSGVMTGIRWYNSMFDTDASGQVTLRQDSGLAGGHEIYVYGHIPAVGNTPARVRFRNHWTRSWGDNGDGLMLVSDWLSLLRLDGDVTKLVPNTEPAPTPVPGPDDGAAADALVSDRMLRWAKARHVGENGWAAKQFTKFAQDTGRWR